MPVFIYALYDPDTGIVRYIGRSFRPEKRYGDHLRDKTRTHRGVWVRSLLAQGRRPLLRLLEETTQELSAEREIHWVSQYRAAGTDLTNLTGGGDGACTDEARVHLSRIKRGRPLTVEHRDALRRAWEQRRQRGVSQETRQKLSQAMAQRYFSPEHRAKISAALRGRSKSPLPDSTRQKLSLALVGRPKSEEARLKLSETRRLRGLRPADTPEIRERRAAQLRGRPRPEEVRQKVSATKRLRRLETIG